jgi:hypothetical protein
VHVGLRPDRPPRSRSMRRAGAITAPACLRRRGLPRGQVLWQLPLPLHEWAAASGPRLLPVQGGGQPCRQPPQHVRRSSAAPTSPGDQPWRAEQLALGAACLPAQGGLAVSGSWVDMAPTLRACGPALQLEFAAAYHRLCGKRVLFPQGYHCTGMPIKVGDQAQRAACSVQRAARSKVHMLYPSGSARDAPLVSRRPHTCSYDGASVSRRRRRPNTAAAVLAAAGAARRGRSPLCACARGRPCHAHPQACADKLDRELKTYGCPPQFPSEDDAADELGQVRPCTQEALIQWSLGVDGGRLGAARRRGSAGRRQAPHAVQ